MKKSDFLLLGSVLLAALLCLAGYRLFFHKAGNVVEITVDGSVYKTLPLNTDTILEIPSGEGHTNQLEIKDGYANMTTADCPDKLCVHQKKISKNGETIVCLPHKVVITVHSQRENTLDGVAN